ncbi:uncharacterized protein BO88DRAFT_271703 [Aspergillus vadensis CBS 113365]|uniref:Transmembrane protein n=1 Tax=Aspergillus vadensis (strain CBS 113365 / IMI 142717 / IBT 24658) TaxID=1448311 RepID=A0A319BVT1_ASPVC|nr:hypothetical protein BO88DRAFT_271703 [Aspergillus vadensis CBS 113365]PYH69963.1 hypothetical protein BO88DRAFT_271703 [Aspergillus vadensis CBS 113365]
MTQEPNFVFRLSASLAKLYFFSCLSLQLLRHSFLFFFFSTSYFFFISGLHPSCILNSLSCILPPLLARLPSLISPPSFPFPFSASRSPPRCFAAFSFVPINKQFSIFAYQRPFVDILFPFISHLRRLRSTIIYNSLQLSLPPASGTA